MTMTTTEAYWVQQWSCPSCDAGIEGTEADTRDHLASQLGGTVDYSKDYNDSLVCKCGSHMECEWELRDEDYGG
jgi:hypothetical protein